MASTPTIQRGTKTLGDGSSSMTIVRGTDSGFDTTVTATKTIVRVSTRPADGAPTNASVRYTLTDGDTITVTRNGTTGSIPVIWELISFASGVDVQHVTATIASSGSSDTETITAVDLAKSWIMPCGQSGPESDWSHIATRWRFNSTTQVQVDRNGTPASALVACAQVITHDSATVQTVEFTLTASTATEHDETVTAVADTAATLIVGTCKGTTGQPRDSLWRMTMSDTTSLIFTRNTGTSGNYTFTVFLVEFSDGTTVQRTSTGATSSATVDVTISAIATARSSAGTCATDPWQCGCTNDSFATTVDRILFTSELTTTTNHQLVRDATTSITAISQVIQFAAAASSTLGAQADAVSTTTTTLYKVTQVDAGAVETFSSVTVSCQVVTAMAPTTSAQTVTSSALSVVYALGATVAATSATSSTTFLQAHRDATVTSTSTSEASVSRQAHRDAEVTATSSAAATMASLFAMTASVASTSETALTGEVVLGTAVPLVGKYKRQHAQAYRMVQKAGG